MDLHHPGTSLNAKCLDSYLYCGSAANVPPGRSISQTDRFSLAEEEGGPAGGPLSLPLMSSLPLARSV